VCDPCTSRTIRQLGAVPALLAELDTTVTRQHRFRSTNSRVRGSSETVVPFHVAASRAAHDLDVVLRREAALVAEVVGAVLPTPSTAVTAAGFLAGMADWIATRPAGPDFVDKIAVVTDRAWAVIDRPVDRHYLGACDVDDCTGTLYQHGDRADARCSECRTQVPAQDRRADLQAQLAHQVLSAADIERVTAATGERVSAGKVRMWASRGRLQPVASIPWDAPPRYRLADVLALAGGA
jgi:hypothetical protein